MEVRERIIKRSQSHSFTKNDFQKIKQALGYLKNNGWGDHLSWTYVLNTYGDLFDAHLLGENPETERDNALDDIGCDEPGKVDVSGSTYRRDPNVRNAVLRWAGGNCEYCTEVGFVKNNGDHYLETHHIIALAKAGPDKPNNVIAVCANDHRKAHYSADWEAINTAMQEIVNKREVEQKELLSSLTA